MSWTIQLAKRALLSVSVSNDDKHVSGRESVPGDETQTFAPIYPEKSNRNLVREAFCRSNSLQGCAKLAHVKSTIPQAREAQHGVGSEQRAMRSGRMRK